MPQPPTGSPEQQVRGASDRYMDALRRLDHEAAGATWAEDALLMPSGAPDLKGGPAIRAMMADVYPTIRFVELKVRSTEIRVAGELAFEVTHYEERIGGPDGTDVDLDGRMVLIWGRDPSGGWKILRGMYNYTG